MTTRANAASAMAAPTAALAASNPTAVLSTHTAPAPTDPRWLAVLRRDPAADGAFCFAVVTTGVYCRPSCAARRPNRANVRLFDRPAQAEAAGFRPCKRCRPDLPPRDERERQLVARACDLIAESESPPRLADLAAALGVGATRLHGLFKAHLGLTPRAYAAALRAERVRDALVRGTPVTEALYAAGFNGSAPFYAAADRHLGMTPSAYRGGGAGEAIGFAIRPSTLGHVLVAASERGVCAILLGDDPAALEADLAARFPAARLERGGEGFSSWVDQAVGLVERPGIAHDLPLDVRGTAFQARVWEALRAIPPGATDTYAGVAARIGQPGAARAVAAACAANPLAVAVPCHRVVRADGSRSGYRWGTARKAELLAREARARDGA